MIYLLQGTSHFHGRCLLLKVICEVSSSFTNPLKWGGGVSHSVLLKPAWNVTNSRDSWKNDCVDFHLFVLGSRGWVQLIVHCDVCKYRSSPLAWLDQLVWGDQLPHVMSADLLTIQQWNQTGTASTDTNLMFSSTCILFVLSSQTLHSIIVWYLF